MFICEKCSSGKVDSFYWVVGPFSHGKYEVCGEVKTCVDVHHSKIKADEPQKSLLQEYLDKHNGGEENLFIKNLRRDGLNDSQILSVLFCIDETCNHCWDGDNGCQCWNDE